jgi:predicted nucleic acid-binding protein
MKTYVLDSFALLALFRNEPGGPFVQRLLRTSPRESSFAMSAVNLGEVIYRTIREYGTTQAQVVLAECRALPIRIVPVDERLAVEAAVLKGAHRISYADCIAAALARRLEARLVTGDAGFGQIAGLQIEWLPSG